ncbi:hypothetical protein WJX77_005749 [Trebouxia sp. C0004]
MAPDDSAARRYVIVQVLPRVCSSICCSTSLRHSPLHEGSTAHGRSVPCGCLSYRITTTAGILKQGTVKPSASQRCSGSSPTHIKRSQSAVLRFGEAQICSWPQISASLANENVSLMFTTHQPYSLRSMPEHSGVP